MKRYIMTTLAAVSMFAAGCSTTFTEYRGQSIVEGKGGTVRKVDGIDFWENGDPDRKYQILGVIDDSRGDSIFVPGKDGAIAKVAREHGGDAVVLLRSERELGAIDNDGSVHYRRITKVAVVKYVQ